MLEHIRYEMEAVLLDPPYDHSVEELRESVTFRKFCHGRALLDFFTGRNAFNSKGVPKTQKDKTTRDEIPICPDDVNFSQYGIDRPWKPFPEDVERNEQWMRDEVNKCLMHISSGRVDRPPLRKEWPADFLPPIEQLCIRFIDLLLSGGLPVSVTPEEREKWDLLKRNWNNGNPKRGALMQNTGNVPNNWGNFGIVVSYPRK